MFHCATTGILITGDALWHIKHGGMGFVWPNIDEKTGRNTFIDAAFATLAQIEMLNPRLVIPGHGQPFSDVQQSIDGLRARLKVLAENPEKNARHVVKVMLVFALLDKQQMKLSDLPRYLAKVPLHRDMNEQYLRLPYEELATRICNELVSAGAIQITEDVMRPTMRA